MAVAVNDLPGEVFQYGGVSDIADEAGVVQTVDAADCGTGFFQFLPDAFTDAPGAAGDDGNFIPEHGTAPFVSVCANMLCALG